MGSDSTAIFLQIVLDGMCRARDVKLAVDLVDYQWSIADDHVARLAGLNVTGTVIEVEPAKVMLVDPNDHQLLDVAILVLGQGRVEIERGDLVFLEPGID
jgi:hypothetical protein